MTPMLALGMVPVTWRGREVISGGPEGSRRAGPRAGAAGLSILPNQVPAAQICQRRWPQPSRIGDSMLLCRPERLGQRVRLDRTQPGAEAPGAEAEARCGRRRLSWPWRPWAPLHGRRHVLAVLAQEGSLVLCGDCGRAAVGGCWGARGRRPSSRVGRCGSRCRSLWVGLPQPHSAGDGVACSQMCGRWAPRPPLLPP